MGIFDRVRRMWGSSPGAANSDAIPEPVAASAAANQAWEDRLAESRNWQDRVADQARSMTVAAAREVFASESYDYARVGTGVTAYPGMAPIQGPALASESETYADPEEAGEADTQDYYTQDYYTQDYYTSVRALAATLSPDRARMILDWLREHPASQAGPVGAVREQEIYAHAAMDVLDNDENPTNSSSSDPWRDDGSGMSGDVLPPIVGVDVTLAEVDGRCGEVILPGHIEVGATAPCPNGDHDHYILDAVHTVLATNSTVVEVPIGAPEFDQQVAEPELEMWSASAVVETALAAVQAKKREAEAVDKATEHERRTTERLTELYGESFFARTDPEATALRQEVANDIGCDMWGEEESRELARQYNSAVAYEMKSMDVAEARRVVEGIEDRERHDESSFWDSCDCGGCDNPYYEEQERRAVRRDAAEKVLAVNRDIDADHVVGGPRRGEDTGLTAQQRAGVEVMDAFLAARHEEMMSRFTRPARLNTLFNSDYAEEIARAEDERVTAIDALLELDYDEQDDPDEFDDPEAMWESNLDDPTHYPPPAAGSADLGAAGAAVGPPHQSVAGEVVDVDRSESGCVQRVTGPGMSFGFVAPSSSSSRSLNEETSQGPVTDSLAGARGSMGQFRAERVTESAADTTDGEHVRSMQVHLWQNDASSVDQRDDQVDRVE